MKKILVLNGPNLNLVGIREPEIYGVRGYSELVDYIRSCGESLGVEVDVRQSNHEGVLIDWIYSHKHSDYGCDKRCWVACC